MIQILLQIDLQRPKTAHLASDRGSDKPMWTLQSEICTPNNNRKMDEGPDMHRRLQGSGKTWEAKEKVLPLLPLQWESN